MIVSANTQALLWMLAHLSEYVVFGTRPLILRLNQKSHAFECTHFTGIMASLC